MYTCTKVLQLHVTSLSYLALILYALKLEFYNVGTF